MSAFERTLKQHLVSYRIKDILLTCHTNTLTGGLDLQHGTVIWCFLVNWYLGLPFHAIDMGQTEGWTDGRTAALLYAPILMAGRHNRAYPPRWKRSICCIYVVFVCLSHISAIARPILATFCACYMTWPWLVPPLAALRYVMHFWCYRRRHLVLHVIDLMDACRYRCSEWANDVIASSCTG